MDPDPCGGLQVAGLSLVFGYSHESTIGFLIGALGSTPAL